MPNADLASFMTAYEAATNSHDIDRVVPFIAHDATYWFTEGSYQGISEIRAAMGRTFGTIEDEVYRITDLEWVTITPKVAVCRYRFAWTGIIAGEARSGSGRATNVLVHGEDGWRIQHEHLSA